MWIHERHQRFEAVVGDAQRAHLAIGLRHVLHEPVDRVVGVGGLIDGGRILWPAQGAIHYVVALGAVLASHVLHDADIAILDDHIGRVVVALQHSGERSAV